MTSRKEKKGARKAKRKRRLQARRHTASTFRQQALRPEQINITQEAQYIMQRAKQGDSRVVSLGPLILFSTETGDAWMLDPKEQLALCLMQDGEAQQFTVTETPSNFSIEWGAQYSVEKDAFIVSGEVERVSTRLNYPIREILQATRRILSS